MLPTRCPLVMFPGPPQSISDPAVYDGYVQGQRACTNHLRAAAIMSSISTRLSFEWVGLMTNTSFPNTVSSIVTLHSPSAYLPTSTNYGGGGLNRWWKIWKIRRSTKYFQPEKKNTLGSILPHPHRKASCSHTCVHTGELKNWRGRDMVSTTVSPPGTTLSYIVF